jgi:diguanylate cyclase (GGDEF)-like protein
LRYEELQAQLGEGPCLAAYETGQAVAVADLRDESRFPAFAPRALEAGLVAVFTFPLRNGSERLGALDLYRDTPGLLDVDDMGAAQTLADVAAAYLLNAQARTDLRESSDRSYEQALHDPLTGLPNRILLLERLDHAVRRGRRSGKMAAVLFADLDGFKSVNDLHGHRIGDDVLVAVANRLTAVLRPGDTLARMSGDEFVILCEDLDGPEEVNAIAVRICAAIAAPFVLDGAEVEMTVSVGIAFSGRGDQLSEELLQDADTAMYQAKREGGASHQIVDIREQHPTAQRSSLQRDLRGAKAGGELQTEYQPIVETDSGRIRGVEALLRWEHPSRGSVAPSLLVPLAEQAGLITEIGQWVLEQACQDRHRWQAHNLIDDLTMSVNVSASQVMSPDFVATVASVLSRTDTDPRLVTLEVTEGGFLQDGERALVVLTEQKHVGVKLALDDFGTGYSSLSYLKRFPIDIVKIDQAFITDLDEDRASYAIVCSVIELAHLLDMTVVAEGVESAAQHKQLAALGCDYCQGNYFAGPLSTEHLDYLIRRHNNAGAVYLPALAAAANA